MKYLVILFVLVSCAPKEGVKVYTYTHPVTDKEVTEGTIKDYLRNIGYQNVHCINGQVVICETSGVSAAIAFDKIVSKDDYMSEMWERYPWLYYNHRLVKYGEPIPEDVKRPQKRSIGGWW